jgi:hypothetical protein
MPDLAPILSSLAQAQRELLRTADSIAPEDWRVHPDPDKWCAAEVVAHLMMVERFIIATADRLQHKVPRPHSFFQRRHLPVRFVALRLTRLKTPIPLDPQFVGEKESMLGELRAVRERTLAFIDETKERDLSPYRWKHMFLGSLNTYDWFQLIASHEARHEKQVRQIASALRKPRANFSAATRNGSGTKS